MTETPPIVLYAIPFFVISMLIEWPMVRRRQLGSYQGADTAANLTMGLGSLLANGLWKIPALALWFWAYEHRLFDRPDSIILSWVLGLLLYDFCYYCFHRFGHRARIGWAAHINHHSSERMNLSVALRQSWTTGLYTWAFYLPLAFAGFNPVWILAFNGVNLVYQYWIHTETVNRLGPLEWLFNTPSHHRVHHGTNPQYIDKNYGGIFIIFDRLFGTFAAEKEPVVYGIGKPLNTHNPLTIAFHEWKTVAQLMLRSGSFTAALKILFQPPLPSDTEQAQMAKLPVSRSPEQPTQLES